MNHHHVLLSNKIQARNPEVRQFSPCPPLALSKIVILGGDFVGRRFLGLSLEHSRMRATKYRTIGHHQARIATEREATKTCTALLISGSVGPMIVSNTGYIHDRRYSPIPPYIQSSWPYLQHDQSASPRPSFPQTLKTRTRRRNRFRQPKKNTTEISSI